MKGSIQKSQRLSEHDTQSLILDWLNRSGIFAFRINTAGIYDTERRCYRTPGKFTLKGVSDILGVLPNGRFLAIEVKSKTGKATMEQEAFIEKVKKKGGVAFIARSLDEVIRRLKNE